MKIAGKTISGGAASGGGLHIPTPAVSGRIYSLKINGTGNSTSITIANGMRLMPFYPINRITASSFSINVTVASAVTIKILVFSNLNGNPDTKLFESADLSCSTTGIKTADARGLNFSAGTVYWIGIIASGSGPTLTSFSTNAMTPINEAGVASVVNFFVGATAYSYAAVPSTVAGSNFFPAASNCPAVWITAL
jgi:hypothetical protein